ncbi:MAG: stage V sporulation protein B [Firmicutes bacterium]|nr:stage V sporulation protein B [Bacillota bacterium]
MRKQSLLQGAFVLTAAALITKILGFATTILQSRILGAEAIGLQMMVTPYISLLMTVTTLGLPVAISKAVAEAETRGNEAKIKRILLVSLTLTCSTALILTLGLLYFGRAFSEAFLADQRAYYSLMALIPVIPILALSGVLRGYFQGRQNMNPLAISQVIEQVIRIVLLYVLVQVLAERGIEYAAAGGVLASVLGEFAALLYLGFQFRTGDRYRVENLKVLRGLVHTKVDFIELMRTGLPQTGNQFFRSLLRVIQPTLITRSLLKTGLTASAIAEQFGMLTGYVYPLLFFPGFINYSLAVALVPAISEAASRKRFGLVNRRVSHAVRISLLVGVPSSIILYVFADQILTLFYRAPEAAGLLKLTAPFYLFQYFHSPMHSSLVGLGHASTAMFNNIVPRCISLALIYPFSVSLGMGIYGVAAASIVAVIMETILHYAALYRSIGSCFQFKDVAKIIGLGIIAGAFGKFTFDTLLMYPVSLQLAALIAILVLLFIYFALIFITNTVRWSAVWITLKRR